MDSRTMRTLREYIHELRSGDWNHNRTGSSSGFDTTLESHGNGDEGNRSGDAGCSQNDTGKSGNNIPG